MANRSRRQRAAWGSLEYDPRTRTARIRYWAEGPDGYRRRSKTLRDVSRVEAEAKRAELMLAHSEDAPCPTVGTVWTDYALPEMRRRVDEGELSSRSVTAYERSWARDVEPTWGAVPCDQVRPLQVQQWITAMQLSAARRAVQVLSKVMTLAVRYGWAPTNPMREKYVMPAKSTVAQRDKGTWTLEGLAPVWRAVRDRAPWMEASFLLCAFAGVRVSESLGPLAGEVELREVSGVPVALVPIVRQVTKEEGVSERMKTERSRRTAIVAGAPAVRIASIAAALPPDWPLTNDGQLGRFQSRDRLNAAWNRDVLPALPEGERHPMQNLRNSWQTWMRWTLGVAPHHIEVLMGHVGKGVTGQHYDRPRVEMLARVVADAWGRDGTNWDANYDS